MQPFDWLGTNPTISCTSIRPNPNLIVDRKDYSWLTETWLLTRAMGKVHNVASTSKGKRRSSMLWMRENFWSGLGKVRSESFKYLSQFRVESRLTRSQRERWDRVQLGAFMAAVVSSTTWTAPRRAEGGAGGITWRSWQSSGRWWMKGSTTPPGCRQERRTLIVGKVIFSLNI